MTRASAPRSLHRFFSHNLVASCVVAAIAVAAPGAQSTPGAPTPVTAQRGSGSPGIIRGHVVADDTGRPLARVRVTLVPATPRTGEIALAASTNAKGDYQIKDVAPGLYRVSASRAGYLTVQWGQRRVRETGQSIDVKSGETLERIDVRLPKGGVLAGQVTDEFGLPYPGVRVEAMDLRYTVGSRRRVPFPTGFAITDDRGAFRMSGLQPGAYYVAASSTEKWTGPDRQSYGYAPAYFPGGAIGQAQPINLGLAEQRTGLALSLSAGRGVRVSGLVQSAAGTPLAGETVQMPSARFLGSETAMLTIGVAVVRTSPQGTFEIKDVIPGDYRISTSRRSSDGQTESAAMRLRIGDAPIEGLVLMPRAGSTMTGSVVADEGGAFPFPATRLRILLFPGVEDKEISSSRSFDVTADGTFRMNPVRGPVLFRLSGLPDTWMIKSVRLNDEDITEVPYDIPDGGKTIEGLKIVVSQKMGSVAGSITDEKGSTTSDATVVLFADDATWWLPYSRFVRVMRPGADGRFTIRQLPPGRYLAAARTFVEDAQENDPDFLESLRRDASRFELLEGGTATVTLKLPRP